MKTTHALGKLALVGLVAVSGMLTTSCAKKNHGHAGYVPIEEYNSLRVRVESLEKGGRPVAAVTPSGKASRLTSPVPAGMKSAYMALPTGSESTSALLVEKLVPATGTANEPFQYSIKVTNLTDDLRLENVTIDDRFSADFAYASSTPEGLVAGRTARWTIANLAPGASETITVNGSGRNTGEIENCTTAVFTPVFCISTLIERPALEVTYVGTETARTCDPLSYKIVVKNTGTGAAKNVTVTEELPAGLTTADGQTSISFPAGDLATGESKEFTFAGKANAAGSYTSNVTAKADNVSAVDSTNVRTEVCQAKIAVTATGTNRLYLGNQGSFEATVTNPGGCSTDNSVLVATLPACTSFVSATDGGVVSGNTVTWSLGNLAAAATKSVSVRVAAADKCEAKVDFAVKGDCAEPATAEVPIVVEGIPAIVLEVIDITDPVRVGESTIYKITARNQGSAIGTNVTITTKVEQMTITSATGATAGTISGKTANFAPLAVLKVGEEVVWNVEVKVDAAGDQRFSVQLNSDQLTRPVDETEATNTYE